MRNKMQTIQVSYSCIDCFKLLSSQEDKQNSTYCEDCLSLVCNDCINVELDIYLCSSCLNERYAREDSFE